MPASTELDNPNPPSARELILRLFIAPGGQTVKATEVVKACRLFDISENSARVALSRLMANKLLTMPRRGEYCLGTEATKLGGEIRSWRQASDKLIPWDNSWLVAATSSLGRTNRKAIQVRERALTLFGMRHLDAGLYIRPNNFKGGLKQAQDKLIAIGLEPHTPMFEASSLDSTSLAKASQLWAVDQLETEYSALTKTLQTSLSRLPSLNLEQAAKESYLLGDQAVRQLIFDPLLPAPLINESKRETFNQTVQRYDANGGRIWHQYLSRD